MCIKIDQSDQIKFAAEKNLPFASLAPCFAWPIMPSRCSETFYKGLQPLAHSGNSPLKKKE